MVPVGMPERVEQGIRPGPVSQHGQDPGTGELSRRIRAGVGPAQKRAREAFPSARPRVITDNGPQFVSRDFKSFIRLCGMTHVRTRPYYPQSNGKLERYHKTLKRECVRPGVPLSLDDARRMVGRFVEAYNAQRLHSGIGHITPKDKLAGRAEAIWAERERGLAAAREARRRRRQAKRASKPLEAPSRDRALRKGNVSRSSERGGRPIQAEPVHAYNAKNNALRPLLYDGTDMAGYIVRKSGDFGREGKVFRAFQAHPGFLLSYALCYRQSEDAAVWDTLRGICRGNDLGDIGLARGKAPKLNLATKEVDPDIIFGLVEVFCATGNRAYLDLARAVANNALKQRYNAEKWLFVMSDLHQIASLGTREPLAFITLAAALKSQLHRAPAYDQSNRFIWARTALVAGRRCRAAG
jgi:hypothetical protein